VHSSNAGKILGKNEAVFQLCTDFKNGYDRYRRAVLHNILIELDIPINIGSLKNLSELNLQYSSVDQPLSHTFTIKSFEIKPFLSPLIFNFISEYSVRRVHVKQDDWKLSGIHQDLFYADYFNILGGNVHSIK